MKTILPLPILFLLLSGSRLVAQQSETSHYCQSILSLVDSAIARQQLDTALVRLQDVEICDYHNKLQTERLERQNRIFTAIQQQKETAEIERANAEAERARAVAARNQAQRLQKDLQKSYDELAGKEKALAASLQQVEKEKDIADKAKIAADSLAQIAEQERDKAKEQETIARARAILAQAQAAYNTDHTVALNLVVASLNMKETPEAREFLSYVLSNTESFFYQQAFEHPSGIECVSLSPSGDKILTGSQDGSFILWDANTAAYLHGQQGHKNPILKAAFSTQGDKIATLSVDSVKVWNARSYELLFSIPADKLTFSGVVFSADGHWLLVETAAGVGIWNAQTGDRKEPIPSGVLPDDNSNSPKDYVVVFRKKKKILRPQYDDKRVLVYDLQSKKYIYRSRLKDSKNTFRRFSLSPDGRKLIANSFNGFVGVWDLRNGKLLFNLTGHDPKTATTSGVFSSDGRHILTASFDGTVKLWDAATGTLLQTMKGHSESWLIARFLPGNRRIVSCSRDGQGRIWDAEPSIVYAYPDYSLEDNKLQRLIKFDKLKEKGGKYRILGISASPVAEAMAIRERNGFPQLFNPVSGKKMARLGNRASDPVVYFPDSNKVMIESQVWEIGHPNRLLYALPGYYGDCDGKAQTEPVFSRDRTLGLQGSDGKQPTLIWDVHKGASRYHLDTLCMQAATFFPKGDKAAIAYRDGKIGIWEIAARARVKTISAGMSTEGSDFVIKQLAISPGEDQLVVLAASRAEKSDTNTIRWEVWDLNTPRLLFRNSTQIKGGYAVAVSPNADQVLVISEYLTAAVFDALTGKPLATYKLPSNYAYFQPYYSATYSPQGDKIILASAEAWARSFKYAKIRNYFWEWEQKRIYELNKKERAKYGIE